MEMIEDSAIQKFMNTDWGKALQKKLSDDYFRDIERFLKTEKDNNKVIYPPDNQIFRAFELTPFSEVKVVILGQDPYLNEGEAEGLAFSVNNNIVKRPPSLKNILKKVQEETGCKKIESNSLVPWARQGVLLLNRVLTVEKGKSNSHKNKIWEKLTDEVIKTVSEEKSNVVFMLWGKEAQRCEKGINTGKHIIIKSSHPSPFSVRITFNNTSHFQAANDYLKQKGKSTIDWAL